MALRENELLDAGWTLSLDADKKPQGYKHPPVKSRGEHSFISEDGRLEVASLERIHTLDEALRIFDFEKQQKEPTAPKS